MSDIRSVDSGRQSAARPLFLRCFMRVSTIILVVGLLLTGISHASALGKSEKKAIVKPTTCTPSGNTGYKEGVVKTPGCDWRESCPCDCKVKWDDTDGLTANALVEVDWSTLTQYSTHVWVVQVSDPQQLCSLSGTLLNYVIFTDNGTTPPSL